MELCQRSKASCGACCGLYNRRDPGRAAIRGELARRTRALRELPRTPEAFRAAAAALLAAGPPPLFPSVRVCPLLGFLDDAGTRLGCLAHPAATGGPDLRDCGVYDARICDTFFCPSFSWLGEEEAALAEAAVPDFYLYGLVVTDVPFLRASLAGVAALVGAKVELRHLSAAPFRSALRRLLALKEELAPGSDGIFGAFSARRADAPGAEPDPAPAGGSGARPHGERPAEEPDEVVPRRIDYAGIVRAPSPYDEILTCAGADPRSGNDLDRFEAEVRRRLDACAASFPAAG
jgi:hypothetical protein